MAGLFDSLVAEINNLFYGPVRRKPSNKLYEKPKANDRDLQDVLHVKSIDLLIKTNNITHHTDKYDCTVDRTTENGEEKSAELVLRRGGDFELSITFNRPLSLEKDDMWFILSTGWLPQMDPSTHGRFQVDESGKEPFRVDKWGGRLLERDGNTARFQVQVPVTAAVGEWSLVVQTANKHSLEKKKYFIYENPDDFYVLFNPWCKEDQTYVNSSSDRDEYVLNDHGCIFRGCEYKPRPKEWNYGQFEDGILEAAVFLINKCVPKKKCNSALANPVRVARIISQVVNHADKDAGVLYGRWGGNYGDGTPPTQWCGSVQILRQYMANKVPVRYGQCWVFSGVATTVCRALGLPARSVTNYESAHDTDASNTIDKFYKTSMDGPVPDYDLCFDSVWNFHVWNEVWMKRPDIASNTGEMDGWQVIDSTPQEKSQDVYQCGPCPQYAVKHGMISVNYDCSFIFSEVNADEVHWMMDSRGNPVPIKIKIDKIGKRISTKTPDGKPYDKRNSNTARLDITDDYKYPEDSEENRRAVLGAAIGARSPKDVYGRLEEQDIEFKLLHEADLALGEDVEVKLTAKNTSEYVREITLVSFRFLRQNYTGETVGVPFKVDVQKKITELKPKQVHEFKTFLSHSDYLPALDDGRQMCIQAFSVVKATRSRAIQNCVKAHTVEFGAPELDVQLPDSVKLGDHFEAVVTFNNPIKHDLTNCTLGCEGRGVCTVADLRQDNVPELGTFTGRLQLEANRTGAFTLLFKFTSKELSHLSGSKNITVE